MKWVRKLAGAYRPTSRNSSAPTPNTIASDFTDIGSLAPWPWPLGAVIGAFEAFDLVDAAGSLGGGAGQAELAFLDHGEAADGVVLEDSTTMLPSLALHSSSVRRRRLFEYRVEDCLASRLTRSV